jgi:hypothetical protein
MRRTIFPLLGLILLPLALGGCGAAVGTVAAGATVATYATTDRLPTDHLVSAASGEDCTVLHMADGEPYCQTLEDPEMRQLREANNAPYCYRTLGEITCYDTPDPYNNTEVPVR